MKLFQRLNPFDRLMAAISFAEGNEGQTASSIMETGKGRNKRPRTRKTPENQAENRQQLRV